MMVIAIDTWRNVNNNNSRKNLYNTFIVNTWNHRSKIIPLKMENIKAAKYLSDMEVRPNVIFLNIDVKYSSDYLSILNSVFPNTLMIGNKVKGLSKQIKAFVEKHKEYKLELDKDAFAFIPNYQKYNQSKNYGLKFEMIAPNTEEPKMRVGIIIPLICENDERTCDIKSILCKHYHQFDQTLDNLNSLLYSTSTRWTSC